MQNSRLTKIRTVLSVLLLLFTIFSALLTAAEASHESQCVEENCPVCYVIQIAKINLGGLIFVFAASQIVRHFAESKKIAFSSINKAYISNTLFSLKIRLND